MRSPIVSSLEGRFLVAGSVLALFAGSASAQVFTGRTTSLNYNYVYGAGGDVHTGGETRTETTPLLFAGDEMTFQGSTAGELPGDPRRPYTAGVECLITHEYAVIGSRREVERLEASAVSVLTGDVSGAGTSVVFSNNPGNRVMLFFAVDHEVPYRLRGSRVIVPGDLGASVALQYYNGFNWSYLFWSEFLPLNQLDFDVSGTLVPGDYRIIGDVGGRTFGPGSDTASYSYTLEMPGVGGSCPADFNADGFLDFFDYDAFVECFETGGCLPGQTADFNEDDFVDFFDYDDFVAAFEEGC